jgi:hypothetical protein
MSNVVTQAAMSLDGDSPALPSKKVMIMRKATMNSTPDS